MNIYIENQTENNIPVESAAIRKSIRTVLKICGKTASDPYEMSIIFVSKESIREMNRDFRSINRATDVISFAFQEGDGAGYTPYLLGDIAICPDIVEKHSLSYGTSFRTETLFVIIHGVLHLLGFDHTHIAEREKMREKEDEIMKKLTDDWCGRNEN
ncbi:MAG TPA: rRNA maturation RNase YbeY [bacterium]|nr:rRNA maturation RNase YbeY [bacterium]